MLCTGVSFPSPTLARRLAIRLLEGKVHHARKEIPYPQLSIISRLPVARLEELNDNLSEGKGQVWMPQNSRIRVIDEVADRLEAEWEGFLAANRTSDEDLNERGKEYAIQVKRRGGGEGMAHLHLKKYVASNPHALGLHTSTVGIEEYLYVSGDECDVVFDLPDGNSAVVEVKLAITSSAPVGLSS